MSCKECGCTTVIFKGAPIVLEDSERVREPTLVLNDEGIFVVDAACDCPCHWEWVNEFDTLEIEVEIAFITVKVKLCDVF